MRLALLPRKASTQHRGEELCLFENHLEIMMKRLNRDILK
jgi:hypothetical protein